MTLGELLDELRGSLLRDRSDLIAGEDDSLWTDEALLRYIQDAERRFARQTLLLRDSTTSEFCQLTLKEAQRTYPLHRLVLGIVSARAAGLDLDLVRTGHAGLQPPRAITSPEWFDPSYGVSLQPGAPLAFYTDETLVYAGQGVVTFSIYPLPDAAADGTVIDLRVVRLPKGDYTVDSLDEESEIPQDYQLDVLRWAAYRAQSTYDGDAGASGIAAQHKAAFEEAVVLALKETKRKMFSNQGIGYGQNGFSWTR